MSNLRRIGIIDELIEAIRTQDPDLVLKLQAEQAELLEQERRATLTNAAKCMTAEHFIPADFFNVRLN